MSEPTYPGDERPRGDWSQVYTGLDWVAQWMADHGYTEAEIGYVVGEPAAPAADVEATPVPVEVSAPPAPVETEQSTWIVPLAVADGDPAETGEHAPADVDDTEDAGSPEWVVA